MIKNKIKIKGCKAVRFNIQINLYLKYLVIDNNFACGKAEQGVCICKTFSRMGDGNRTVIDYWTVECGIIIDR